MAQYYSSIQPDFHHSYIKRTACRDQSKDFPEQYIQYSLLSLAKNDIRGIDIYLLYFPSYFKSTSGLNALTKINELEGVKYEHFSYFFRVFIQIYGLKYIVFAQDQQRTEIIKNVLEELVGQHRTQVRNEVSFAREVKNIVTEVLEKPAYREWMKREMNFQIVLEIQNQIKEILQGFYRVIDDEYFMQNLGKTQVFFDNWIHNHQDIKRSMAIISKIKSLHFKSKKIVWHNFYKDNKHFMKMNIPLNEDVSKRDKNINKIIVKRYSKEKYYTYIRLLDYVKNLHENVTERIKFQPILKRTIGSLLMISKQYLAKTNQFFPQLSLNDIFINQRTLELFFAYHNLILYYLGLNHSIKTAELRIASQTTPKGIDKEISYFEVDPKNEVNLKKKFYFYDDNMKKKNEQQSQQKENGKLWQNIHVWRLLNIIRFMQLGAFMSQDFYNRKLCPQRKKLKEISQQKFRQQLKNLKQDLQSGKIKKTHILPILNTYQKDENYSKRHSNTSQKRQYFDFTFKELEQEFDCDGDEDSFLCDNLIKMKMTFYNRALILKELNTKFNERELFRGIPNSLKYQFIYCLSAYEKATKQLQFLHKQKEKRQYELKYKNPNKRQNKQHKLTYRETLQIQLNKQIDDINISKQFSSRSRISKNIVAKLNQYLQRQPTQRNRKYLQNDKSQILNKINEIEQLNKDFTFLNKCRRILCEQDILASRRLIRVKDVIKQAGGNYTQKYAFIGKIVEIEEKNDKILHKMLCDYGDLLSGNCQELMGMIRKIVINCGVVKMIEKFMEKEEKSYSPELLDSLEKIYKSQRVGFIIKLYFMFEKMDILAQTILSSILNQLSGLPKVQEEKFKWYIAKIQSYKSKAKTFLNEQIPRIPSNVLQSQHCNFESEQTQRQSFIKFRSQAQQNLIETIQYSEQPEHH